MLRKSLHKSYWQTTPCKEDCQHRRMTNSRLPWCHSIRFYFHSWMHLFLIHIRVSFFPLCTPIPTTMFHVSTHTTLQTIAIIKTCLQHVLEILFSHLLPLQPRTGFPKSISKKQKSIQTSIYSLEKVKKMASINYQSDF